MATLKLSEITNDRSNNWVRGQAVTSWKTILWNGNLHEIVSPPLLHQNFFSSSLTTFHLSLLLPHNLTPLFTPPSQPPTSLHSSTITSHLFPLSPRLPSPFTPSKAVRLPVAFFSDYSTWPEGSALDGKQMNRPSVGGKRSSSTDISWCG